MPPFLGREFLVFSCQGFQVSIGFDGCHPLFLVIKEVKEEVISDGEKWGSQALLAVTPKQENKGELRIEEASQNGRMVPIKVNDLRIYSTHLRKKVGFENSGFLSV